jgi:hypothetical protein
VTVPLVVFGPAGRADAAAFAVVVALALVLVMDFRLPWSRWLPRDDGRDAGLLVLTCNMAGRWESAERLRTLIGG